MATVTRSGGTFVEGNIYAAGSYHWANLGNLAASDNSRATVTRTGPNLYPYTPVITNFGFTIPAGSVINSITVNIEALKSKNGGDIITLGLGIAHVRGCTYSDARQLFYAGECNTGYAPD